jgi:hypothetical protein
MTTASPPDWQRRERESFFRRTRRQDEGIALGDERGALPQFANNIYGRVDPATNKPKVKNEYAVASYEAFWQVYSSMPAAQRCHYEVQRTAVPGHIYIDAEMDDTGDAATLQARAPVLRQQFLDTFALFLRTEIGGAGGIDIEPLRIVEMDSSSATKLSLHFVVWLRGGRLLMDNRTVGAVMRRYDRWLFRRDPAALRVPHADGASERLFVDLAVYTTKRVFRMVGSAKLGSTRFLRVTAMHGFGDDVDVAAEYGAAADGSGLPRTYEAWARTLVQRAPFADADGVEVLRVAEYDGNDVPQFTSNTYAHMRDLTDRFTRADYLKRHPWTRPRTASATAVDAPICARTLSVGDAWALASAEVTARAAGSGVVVALQRSTSSVGSPSYSNASPTPPPSPSSGFLRASSNSVGAADAAAQLGAVVADVVAELSGVAEVADAQIDAVRRRVTVRTRSHHCAISGREHRSNHVYFQVVLDRADRDGLYMHYRQNCHDDACKRQRLEGYTAIPAVHRARIERVLEARRRADVVSLEALFGWRRNIITL